MYEKKLNDFDKNFESHCTCRCALIYILLNTILTYFLMIFPSFIILCFDFIAEFISVVNLLRARGSHAVMAGFSESNFHTERNTNIP